MLGNITSLENVFATSFKEVAKNRGLGLRVRQCSSRSLAPAMPSGHNTPEPDVRASSALLLTLRQGRTTG